MELRTSAELNSSKELFLTSKLCIYAELNYLK